MPNVFDQFDDPQPVRTAATQAFDFLMEPPAPVKRILASSEQAFKDAPAGSLEEKLAKAGLFAGEFVAPMAAPANLLGFGLGGLAPTAGRVSPALGRLLSTVAAKPGVRVATGALNTAVAAPMAKEAGAAAGEASVDPTPENIGIALGTSVLALLGGLGAAADVLFKPLPPKVTVEDHRRVATAAKAAREEGRTAAADLLEMKATEMQQRIEGMVGMGREAPPAIEAAKVIDDSLVDEERLRQSPQGANLLSRDLGAQEVPPRTDPLSLPVPEETPTAGKLLVEPEAPAATKSKILSSEVKEIPAGVMVSPNISDIQFARARKNLTSSEQGRLKAVAHEVAPDAEIHNALGDWADGAENSLAILFGDVKEAADLERISAQLGLAADQKAVLWWKADPAGADAIHQVQWSKDTTLEQARQSLVDAGIENRTLVETADGPRAILFDQGRQILNKIEELHNHESQPVIDSHPATGNFLGSWTSRAEGRRAYRSVLGRAAEAAESEGGDRPVQVGARGEPEVPSERLEPSEAGFWGRIDEKLAGVVHGEGPSKPELHSNPEAWADAVIAESRSMVNAGLNPELAAAYVIKGSLIIGRGVRDFAQWSAEMVQQFGEGIKDHLQLIYKHAVETAEGRPPKLPLDEEADLGLRLGTRNPTAKSATEAGHLHDTVVDLATLRQDPGLVKKIEDAIRGTLGYLNLGDDPIEGLVRHAQANLEFLMNAVPEEVRAQTKRWYDGARKLALDWEQRYDVPREVTAGVLAALSPQKDWFQNVELAQRVMEIVRDPPNKGRMSEEMHDVITRWIMTTEAESDKALGASTRAQIDASLAKMRNKRFQELDTFEKAVWARAYSEAHLSTDYHMFDPEGTKGGVVTKKSGAPRKLAWSGFNNELSAAIAIMENPTRENISAQLGVEHKVRNFYNNILLPNDPRFGDVTIDTHAVAAALLRPLAGKDVEVKQNFGAAGGSDVLGVSGLYPVYAEAYRRAAKDFGLLPRELQSITWEAVRGLFPQELKKKNSPLIGAVNRIWHDYGQGKITLQQAQQAVEQAAGGVRIPEWLGPDFRAHAEGKLADDARRVPVSEPTGLGQGYGGRAGGYPAADVPRGVPEEIPRGELTVQPATKGTQSVSDRLFSRAAKEEFEKSRRLLSRP